MCRLEVGRGGELQVGEWEIVKGGLFLIVLSNSVLQCKSNALEKKILAIWMKNYIFAKQNILNLQRGQTDDSARVCTYPADR
jgi:hypothetical protein